MGGSEKNRCRIQFLCKLPGVAAWLSDLMSLIRLTKVALLMTLGLFVAHFALVAKYAVNVSYLDAWEALTSSELEVEFSFTGCFSSITNIALSRPNS